MLCKRNAVPDGDVRYEVRITQLSVQPPGEPLWSEKSTDVSIGQEAGKECAIVRQKSGHVDTALQTVIITKEEWPALQKAIDFIVSECREE